MENIEFWRLVAGAAIVLLLGIGGAIIVAILPTKASERAIEKEVKRKRQAVGEHYRTNQSDGGDPCARLERELEREIKAREKAEVDRDNYRAESDHWKDEARRLQSEMQTRQARCEAQGSPCAQNFEPVELQQWKQNDRSH